jgi:hypothetical protein
MEIKFGWSGKRATTLGLLVLLGADVYHLFPDMAIYIIGIVSLLARFTRQ